jgi:O-antigen/teichoic acid export membrane protein
LVLALALLGIAPYHAETNRFIALVGGLLVGESVCNLGQALFLAMDKAWVMALTSTLAGFLRVALCLALFLPSQDMTVLAVSLVCASWTQAIATMVVARRQMQLAAWRLDWAFCRRQLKAGLPFVAMGALIALDAQSGGILLSAFRSEKAVGAYGMANVFVSALGLVPQAFRAGVFPLMARLYRPEHQRFVELYQRSWRYLAMASLPLAVLVVLFAERMVYLVYGQPAATAVHTLQWLAPTLILQFLHIPNARVLILAGRQAQMARFIALGSVVNLVIGALLTPRFGPVAVAFARLAAMGTLFTLNGLYVYRILLGISPWQLVWRSLVATGVMVCVAFGLLTHSPDVVRAIVGIVAYIAVVVLTRAIPTDEWHWALQTLARWFAPRGQGESR